MKVALVKRVHGLCLVVLLTFLAAFPCPTQAQGYPQGMVRGRLDRPGGPQGVYPAANQMVRLISPTRGASAPVTTGADGMYYFYNIPPGQYSLEIMGQGTVQVNIGGGQTDVPAIKLSR